MTIPRLDYDRVNEEYELKQRTNEKFIGKRGVTLINLSATRANVGLRIGNSRLGRDG